MDKFSLRCQWDIQIEMGRGQLGLQTGIWERSLGRRWGLVGDVLLGKLASEEVQRRAADAGHVVTPAAGVSPGTWRAGQTPRVYGGTLAQLHARLLPGAPCRHRWEEQGSDSVFGLLQLPFRSGLEVTSQL